MHTDALAVAVLAVLCVGFVTVMRLIVRWDTKRWQATLPYLGWLAEMDRAERHYRAHPSRRPAPPSTPQAGRVARVDLSSAGAGPTPLRSPSPTPAGAPSISSGARRAPAHTRRTA